MRAPHSPLLLALALVALPLASPATAQPTPSTTTEAAHGAALGTAGAGTTERAGHRPRARTDRFTVVEDQVLTVRAPGVLRNDRDRHRLRAKRLSAPAHGTARLTRRGALTYAPVADHVGRDVLRYRATDTRGRSDVALVKVRTLAVNDAPRFTAGADQEVGALDGAQSVDGWADDIAAGPANEAGQVVDFDVEVLEGADLFTTAPAVSTDGTLTYAPAVATEGGTALVRVTATDDGGTGRGGVDTSAPQTFDLTVTAPASPVDVVLTTVGTVTEGSEALLEVVTEGLGGDLTYRFDCDGDGEADSGDLTVPEFSCLFPDDGSFDPVVEVVDGLGGLHTDTTDLLVENVAPVLTPPADGNVVEQVLSTLDLGTFTDPGADGPWQVDVDWGDGTTDSFTSGVGDLELDHVWDLDDPDPAYDVTVTVTEAGGTASDTATYAVVVDAVNDLPVVGDHEVTVGLLQLLSVTDLSLLAGAVDPDGDALTVTGLTGPLGLTISQVLGGWTLLPTLALGDGTFPVTYTVSDGQGGTDTGTLTVTVTLLG